MVTDPANWGYASGAVAVLETALLPPRTMVEFAESAPSPADLLPRIRHNPVYADLSSGNADTPMRTAAALETELVHFVQAFVARCPDERVADAFLIDYDLRDLSNYLKAKHAGAERRPVELSRLPEDRVEDVLASFPHLQRIVSDVAAAGKSGDQGLAPFTIDLIIDGGFLEMLPELTAPLGSETLDRWASERQRLAAIEALVRAKMSGIEPTEIDEWLVRRLPNVEGLAAIANADTDDLSKLLGERLPADVAAGFAPASGASSLLVLASHFDAVLEQVLEPARTVTCGPERIFSYLWLLFRENRNLRAALGGFAGKIESRLVAESMRGAA